MRRMTFSGAVLAFACMMSANVAQAHAILEDSQPASHATVPAGPAAIELQFNSRIDRARSVLALLKPDASLERLTIGGNAPPGVMRTQARLAPGAYVLHWQVLAVDGHITRGDLPFTAVAP